MSGPCAKTVVTCTLVTPTGERYVGTNACLIPQTICPRGPGEGYEKCVGICRQEGHAEIVALAAAGEEARGAHAYIEGISYVCRECQEAMSAAGVAAFTLGSPPIVEEEEEEEERHALKRCVAAVALSRLLSPIDWLSRKVQISGMELP